MHGSPNEGSALWQLLDRRSSDVRAGAPDASEDVQDGVADAPLVRDRDGLPL